MTATPIRVATDALDEQERIADLWDGSTPSPFDYQCLLVFRSGKVRLYQFPKSYALPSVIRKAHLAAKWDRAVAFLIRDMVGEVVHTGPVTDALGNALEPAWRDAVQLVGSVG